MPIYQAFNKKTGRWVKYHFTKNGIKVVDVKQRLPTRKFVNIPVRGKKKWEDLKVEVEVDADVRIVFIAQKHK